MDDLFGYDFDLICLALRMDDSFSDGRSGLRWVHFDLLDDVWVVQCWGSAFHPSAEGPWLILGFDLLDSFLHDVSFRLP